MNKNDTIAAYRDFTKWCRDNPHLGLDSRLHSHSGPIGYGGYISHEKTAVAFAAWRAAIEADRARAAEAEHEQLAAPQPAPDVAGLADALRNLLSDDDIRHLRRFQEILEDSDADGHDLPKEAVRRLERAGALRSCGFGRHETTLFGDAILAAHRKHEGSE